MDLKRLEKYFIKNKCKIIKNPHEANYLIYISCGFMESFIKEALSNIKELKESKGELIVGGCLPSISKEDFEKVFNGKYFTTRNIEKIDSFFPGFRYKLKSIPDSNRYHYSDLYYPFTYDLTKIKNIKKSQKKEKRIAGLEKNFIIRIGYGCKANCTYCSHKIAIGPYKSKSPDECLSEFLKGYEEGYRLFTLTAMDTGPYGIDIGLSLPGLINRLLRSKEDVRFILDDINTSWVVKYEEELSQICKNKKIKKIMTCIQSGNPRVLKLMKRYRDLDNLLRVSKQLKKKYPDLLLYTEIMIGFPTETEKEFEDTLHFVKKANFDFLYIYPYYENERIPSVKIVPKCSRQVIKQRMNKAVDFFEKNKISYITFPLFEEGEQTSCVESLKMKENENQKAEIEKKSILLPFWELENRSDSQKKKSI